LIDERLQKDNDKDVNTENSRVERAHLSIPLPANKVFAEDIDDATVDTGTNVVELGDEGVLQPVNEALGDENNHGGREDGL
jgi:hypothetical protein